MQGCCLQPFPSLLVVLACSGIKFVEPSFLKDLSAELLGFGDPCSFILDLCQPSIILEARCCSIDNLEPIFFANTFKVVLFDHLAEFTVGVKLGHVIAQLFGKLKDVFGGEFAYLAEAWCEVLV